MGDRIDAATYKEFISALTELEKEGIKTSYRNIQKRCGRSNGTIKKCFDKYLNELSEPNNDRLLSKEIARAINREIDRHVNFANQELQERIEQVSQVSAQVLAENDELRERLVRNEKNFTEVRVELFEQRSTNAELTASSSREQNRLIGELAAAQSEVVELRIQINALNLDKGKLASALEHEEHVNQGIADKLTKSENELAEIRSTLQGKEISEARLIAELRSATEHLDAHKLKIIEANKALDDLRRQVLDSERRLAGLEALQAVQGKVRQKGTPK